jgi:hypothetical protein
MHRIFCFKLKVTASGFFFSFQAGNLLRKAQQKKLASVSEPEDQPEDGDRFRSQKRRVLSERTMYCYRYGYLYSGQIWE